MKNIQIALIVYDITNKKSFEKLNYWFNFVKGVNNKKEVIFGIVANKNDLFKQ